MPDVYDCGTQAEAPGGGELMPGDYANKAVLDFPRKPTQREQLTVKKQRLSAQLANVNAALAALDENPQLEKFLEVMARA